MNIIKETSLMFNLTSKAERERVSRRRGNAEQPLRLRTGYFVGVEYSPTQWRQKKFNLRLSSTFRFQLSDSLRHSQGFPLYCVYPITFANNLVDAAYPKIDSIFVCSSVRCFPFLYDTCPVTFYVNNALHVC
jgi:hypothetical protein